MPELTAVSIGSFDGVHLGHLALVSEMRRLVGREGKVIILCFDPHPQATLRPDSAPARLSAFDQRKQWLIDAGANEVICIEPTPAFLNQTPQEFISSVVETYSPNFIVEGKDFRFGKNRTGSINTLQDFGKQFNFRAVEMNSVDSPTIDQSIVKVSSSLVRWFVRHGRVRDARLLLGRPYEICAEVVPGDRRGRTLNVPTANLQQNEFLLPADGVYVGTAIRPDGSRFASAISVGNKPMFGKNARVCEAHLIGFNGPLNDYGWTITVQFSDWLRDQLCFDSVDQLVNQIRRDIDRVSSTIMPDVVTI